MSRTRRPWLHGITPGGLIVTVTSALVTLGFTGAAVDLFLQGDVTTGTAVGALASSSLATTVALQARNRPDPAASIEQPATMTASSGPGDG